MPRSSHLLHALAALAGLAAAACASRSAPPGADWPVGSDCTLLQGSSAPGATGRIVVALTGEVEPAHAPDPVNDSERFLFRHLYETLVRVDCAGRVLPGLAESWTQSEDGREWRFALRDDARFWDGSRVTAHDVVESWRRREASGRSLAGILPWNGSTSASVRDLRTVVVRLDEPRAEIPRELAHPVLAVAVRTHSGDWPLGSGAYGIAVDRIEASGLLIARSLAYPDAPVLEVRLARDRDLRDVLDGSTDLLWTADRRVVDYAATLPAYDVSPLAWDRSYALVTSADVAPHSDDAIEALRDALARDAVRAEARPFEPPAWWRSVSECRARSDLESVPVRRARALPRVVYPRDDDVARDLAERWVALSARGSGDASFVGPVRDLRMATALAPRELRRSLAARADLAYIVPFPRHAVAPCDVARVHLGGAVGRDGDIRVLPLVDTRSSLIVRRWLTGLALDGDGTLLLLPATARGRELMP